MTAVDVSFSSAIISCEKGGHLGAHVSAARRAQLEFGQRARNRPLWTPLGLLMRSADQS